VNWQSAESSVEPRLETAPEWSIGEVCEQTGLSARTVRYYEELGLLPGVRRRQGGRRVYGADECERLRFIQRLKALGLSLQEIKELNELYALAGSTRTMLTRLDVLLEGHVAGLDARIEELVDLRDEMMRYRARVASRLDPADQLKESPQDISTRPPRRKEAQ
jgi:DNA-binding transcriptional MerR regulator